VGSVLMAGAVVLIAFGLFGLIAYLSWLDKQ
jgi:hypothetical protein